MPVPAGRLLGGLVRGLLDDPLGQPARWRAARRRHRLPINHPKDDTAIHGLSRDRPWQVEAQSASRRVHLVQRVEAAPYRYDARLASRIDAAGCAFDLDVTNRGAEPMPFGRRLAPWFVRRAGTRLSLPRHPPLHP